MDVASATVSRDGDRVPLPPRTFELFLALIRAYPRLVRREQLLEIVWSGEHVSDQTLSQRVLSLRRALGDRASDPLYVVGERGWGYRLIGPVDRLDGRPSLVSPAHAPSESPYPGLAAFEESDAPHFFGREAEVTALWERLARRSLLAVIGPSGAGKTSFLKAGVVPARPDGWAAVITTPGLSPMRQLARALAAQVAGDAGAVAALLDFERPDVAYHGVVEWRKSHDEAVVLVDQGEELFTLTPAAHRGSFIRFLGTLASRGDVHVLLTLRDDFLMRCHEHPALLPVFQDLMPLGPLEGESLRRALVEPALAQGFVFEEESLVEEMLAAVAGERAPLPLLAFAAAQLWESRDRRRHALTRQGYAATGGVAGALARHAEATLVRIGPEKEGLVREVFRNLVSPSGTRAIRGRVDLLSILGAGGAGEAVLDQLVAARLLTAFEGDGAEEGQRVELAHESLLTAWPRLVRWRAQDEEGALLRDQLRQAVRLWDERGRPPELLWSGTSLHELELWRERYPGRLSDLEGSFVAACLHRAEGHRTRRRRLVTAAFLLLAGVAAAIGVALWQATAARDDARVEARRAEASKLLALAQIRLDEDPSEALAFATASLELADTDEGRLFALRALWAAPPVLDLAVGGSDGRVPAFSPDGRRVAAAGHSGEVRVWTSDGEGPVVLPGHETTANGTNTAAWLSNDVLVTGLCCGRAGRVHVWSLSRGESVRTVEFGGATSWQVGEGGVLAETVDGATGPGRRLRFFPLPDGEPREVARFDLSRQGVPPRAFAPDGSGWLFARGSDLLFRPLPYPVAGHDRRLARYSGDVTLVPHGRDGILVRDPGRVDLWAFPGDGPRRGRSLPLPAEAPATALLDVSGRWITPNPTTENLTRVWSTAALPGSRPLVLRRAGHWHLSHSDVHPRGTWLAAVTQGTARLSFWPLPASVPSVVDGFDVPWRLVAFSPDGRWLATPWPKSTPDEPTRLRLWPLGDDGPGLQTVELPTASPLIGMEFDPRGRFLAVIAVPSTVLLVPLEGGTPRALEGPASQALYLGPAVSPNGSQVAVSFCFGEGDRTLRLWDVETGRLQERPMPPLEDEPSTERALAAYEGGACRCAFVDEATLILTGRGGLRRWDLGTGRVETLRAMDPPKGEVDLALSRDLRTALTMLPPPEDSHSPHVVEVHDLARGTSRPLETFGRRVSAFALDAGGDVVATGDVEGIIRVGRRAGGEPRLLLGHEGAVHWMAISPDGRWLASSGYDDTLRLWAMPDLTRPPLHTLPRDELREVLRKLTNLRAVRDPDDPTGWGIEAGPFPGWASPPAWP